MGSVIFGRKIDSDKLIDKFGCQRLDRSLADRVQRLTVHDPYVFLLSGVFFAQRYYSVWHRFLAVSNGDIYVAELSSDLDDTVELWGEFDEAGKMSASDPNSAIYVTDSPKVITYKV